MRKTYATNKKAFFDYEIIEKYEAGISLAGSEAKAIRMGRVNLKDSFIRVINYEAFIFEMHITHLTSAVVAFKPNEKRDRKLLLHKKQILKLRQQTMQLGYTITALSCYANEKNKIKLEIALVKGKQLHDKRDAIKERESKIEAKRALKDY